MTDQFASKEQHGRNLKFWSRQGRYVLMMMPYADEIIVGAEGCWMRDADGKRILDLASGMFCTLVGHQHPKVTERIVTQTRELLHTGTQYLSPPVLEASAKIAEVAPSGLSKSILLSTGTEANEFAIWAARNVTGKQTVLGFSRGYYGTSVGTKACSSLFSDNTVAVPGFARIPMPESCLECFRQPHSLCEGSCLSNIEEMLAPELEDLAAVLVEPVISAGGMFYPPAGYMRKLKQWCQERGALFIADEAQTCFGRTGKWFGIEHSGIVPDALVLAKGAGNGFPVSAVVVSDDVADRLARNWKFHLSSHQSDPVAAAALAAVIDVVKDENLIEAAVEQGEYFKTGLQSLSEKHPVVQRVRGLGLMLGFDLISEAPSDLVHLFMLGCRQSGVHVTYTLASPTIRVLPPLTIKREEIDFALRVFAQVLDRLAAGQEIMKQASPRNPYTAKLTANGGWTRLLSKLWETSPQHWVQKLRERF